jgi:threonine synthase
MWRYQALLPRPEVPVRYPLAVGGTPLRVTPVPWRVASAPLWLKDETVGPSASNKDRATALVIDAALAAGADTVTTSSTGNAAISTAVGAAAAGLRAVIFVPATCQPRKVEAMCGAGALVFKVVEGYRAAFDLSRAAAAHFGWADRNTGVNPATIEAKKTVAFEIWEQLDREAPDVVVVPVGDGATLVGMAKGFRELRACGQIGGLPRLIGVQSDRCAPVAAAWRGEPGAPARPEETVADGIAVADPSVGDWALEEVRAAHGSFVTVSDEQMLAAVDLLGSAGITAEPAGAAALAGYRCAAETGVLAAPDRVVALITGAGLSPAARPGVPAGREWTISADLDTVRRHVAAVPGP